MYETGKVQSKIHFYYYMVPEEVKITIGADMNGIQYKKHTDADRNCLIEAGFPAIQQNEQCISKVISVIFPNPVYNCKRKGMFFTDLLIL